MLNKFFDFLKNKEKFSQEDIDGMRAEIELLRSERDTLKQQLAALTGQSRLIPKEEEELIPPDEILSRVNIGKGDFRLIGNEFMQLFTGLAGLKPDETILDVGCGIGRMAAALTKYMDARGRYEGFDIVEESVNWCSNNITSRYPNFRFQRANVYNKVYDPEGKYPASEYKFPYEDRQFDFVFLTSVFTHMLPEDMDNYMSEISRVIKRNGRCFVTFFLLNSESLALIKSRASTVDFRHEFAEAKAGSIRRYVTSNQEFPEETVAYNESDIRSLFRKHGLQIIEPLRFGSWCGRKIFITYQDIIMSYKR